jgi:hypothetical protein
MTVDFGMRRRRGGRKPRRCIVRGAVPVWVDNGRWGPRRARVDDCAAVLKAELVYERMLRDGVKVSPGERMVLRWQPDGSAGVWEIKAELVPNRVWHHGRLFIRCARCDRRATRLYVPVVGCDPRCRKCWGLSYQSQSWSYRPSALFGAHSAAAVTTILARRERRQASRLRYAARRKALP